MHSVLTAKNKLQRSRQTQHVFCVGGDTEGKKASSLRVFASPPGPPPRAPRGRGRPELNTAASRQLRHAAASIEGGSASPSQIRAAPPPPTWIWGGPPWPGALPARRREMREARCSTVAMSAAAGGCAPPVRRGAARLGCLARSRPAPLPPVMSSVAWGRRCSLALAQRSPERRTRAPPGASSVGRELRRGRRRRGRGAGSGRGRELGRGRRPRPRAALLGARSAGVGDGPRGRGVGRGARGGAPGRGRVDLGLPVCWSGDM